MSSVRLSKGDAKVLAQVFDPESGPAKAEVVVDIWQPVDRHIEDTKLLARLNNSENDAIRLIESYEKSDNKTPQAKTVAYTKALSILNRIIQEHPTFASARNNRAQLRRWRFGDRHMLCQSRKSITAERTTAACVAVDDLKQCIALASPERAQDPVSPNQARQLGQAYTQLGALYLAAVKDFGELEDAEVVSEDQKAWTKGQFEEEASRCFYLGGLYGNEVAKALAVHTNPHAKLCGSIVKEAMRKELAMDT